MNLNEKLNAHRIDTSQQLNYHPTLFKANNPTHRQELEAILDNTPGIKVFDELPDQLKELAKSRNPKVKDIDSKFKENWIQNHLEGTALSHYGVYAYYPWSKTVLHILDEDEFVELRTNRNRNKITLEESKILSTKKVGVIGLSVGHSVSVTMAMERGFGEIRLADFDLLELTNLNRIRTGLHNLGVSKVVSVAREIMAMDPYVNITTFTEGITEDNIDTFFTEGGMLDAVIDECDGLDIKILCRQKAKAYKIPVIMETSDRGTIDIERFDLEPERPILHGYLEHLDFSNVKNLKTNEEKLPFLLPIAGIDILSEKMKASMLEIDQTLTTWPQLASAVTFGGGMAADVCRRIFLDTFHESGRYHVDLEELIGDKQENAEDAKEELEKEIKYHLDNTRSDYQGQNDNEKAELSPEEFKQIMEVALHSPSGGNSQPWQWELKNHSLLLHHAVDTSTQYLDYKHRGAYISFGCAIENVTLKAHALGLEVVINTFPDPENVTLIAELMFYREKGVEGSESHAFDDLVHAQLNRCTNRKLSKPVKIEEEKLDSFRSMIHSIEGSCLHLIQDQNDIDEIGKLVGIADRMIFTHKESHSEFMNEVRWTKEEAESTRTGIELSSVDFNLSEIAGFKLAKNWAVVNQLKRWNGGGAFEKMGRKCINASSAVALITIPDYTEEAYVQCGRAIQRAWIKANDMGISLQPMSSLIFLFARLIKGEGEGLTKSMAQELRGMRETYERLFPNVGNDAEVFLFRVHQGEFHGPKSYRKNIEEVMI